jgi:hypothetical protein
MIRITLVAGGTRRIEAAGCLSPKAAGYKVVALYQKRREPALTSVKARWRTVRLYR